MDPSSLMAGSLNPLDASARTHDLEYLYALNANVSNFVTVKLFSRSNYHIWKIQIICFMKSHNMAGIVYVSPKASSTEIMDQYDSLLIGWIFGSASENVLDAVVDLTSAKDVWDQLKSFYDTTVSHQQERSGYDIIQLAVIHCSERIYNLIYVIGERKNLYRTIVDSSKNNILHLAGRLAPSGKLNKRRGAVLQLQRELQWCEEVAKVVFPTYTTQDNTFLETPYIGFTREHENLMKDGEQWLKTTAESCSISVRLIITIVFAAAITVPGGSNQETGIPLFRQDIAFVIFAVSDAISFFASSTALLVILSILTSLFAEKDFLISLPRRMLIGICTLLLSAISMMIAFSETLFIVFGHQKPWLLPPICGSSLIPISIFFVPQLPLIKDLFRSTNISEFGPRRRGMRAIFNPDNIRLFFGK